MEENPLAHLKGWEFLCTAVIVALPGGRLERNGWDWVDEVFFLLVGFSLLKNEAQFCNPDINVLNLNNWAYWKSEFSKATPVFKFSQNLAISYKLLCPLIFTVKFSGFVLLKKWQELVAASSDTCPHDRIPWLLNLSSHMSCICTNRSSFFLGN